MISLALGRCYRLGEQSNEARREWAWIGQQADLHPVVKFQCLWSESLENKERGELTASRELTNDAKVLLDKLLEDRCRDEAVTVAKAHFLGALERKPAHIIRHESDLARRGGDYVTGTAKLTDALERYESDPEEGVVNYSELIRAHLHRHEGSLDESIKVAWRVYNEFADQEPRDLRGTGLALRCIAQVQLLEPNPDAAESTLEKLETIDSQVYPRAKSFAILGRAIIQRRLENFPKARQLLQDAERQANKDRTYFEHYYVQLERIALDSEELAHTADIDKMIRDFRKQTRVAEHPTLEFSASLLAVRRFGRRGDYIRDAELSAERIRCNARDGSWELDKLRETIDAIDAERKLPRLMLNLP
jgi:hypothetical protein